MFLVYVVYKGTRKSQRFGFVVSKGLCLVYCLFKKMVFGICMLLVYISVVKRKKRKEMSQNVY